MVEDEERPEQHKRHLDQHLLRVRKEAVSVLVLPYLALVILIGIVTLPEAWKHTAYDPSSDLIARYCIWEKVAEECIVGCFIGRRRPGARPEARAADVLAPKPRALRRPCRFRIAGHGAARGSAASGPVRLRVRGIAPGGRSRSARDGTKGTGNGCCCCCCCC